jgi:hypothetical protein
MQTVDYYRSRAARARRLSAQVTTPDVTRTLLEIAQDYEDIAADLERGAVEITHPSRLPQADHPRA